MMSTMAMASSSLNPDAPLFIPAAYRRVEDFSSEWWDLVQTTAWFRDHWFRQHQLLEEAEAEHEADDIAALLPDDALDLLATDDLFYAPDNHHHQKPAAAYPFPAEADAAVLRTLSLNSPRAIGAHAEKPAAHHVGVKGGAHRAAIHQPR